MNSLLKYHHPLAPKTSRARASLLAMSTRRSSQVAPPPVEAPAPKELPPPKEPRKRQREPEDAAAKVPIAFPITTAVGQLMAGLVDGPCSSAMFRGPMGIALAPSGQLVVCDSDNRRIRRVLPLMQPADVAGAPASEERRSLRGVAGEDGDVAVPGQFVSVQTVCGASQPGCRDGIGKDVAWHDPCGVVVDPTSGIAFVIDAGSHTVRSVGTSGETRTLAGSGKPVRDFLAPL